MTRAGSWAGHMCGPAEKAVWARLPAGRRPAACQDAGPRWRRTGRGPARRRGVCAGRRARMSRSAYRAGMCVIGGSRHSTSSRASSTPRRQPRSRPADAGRRACRKRVGDPAVVVSLRRGDQHHHGLQDLGLVVREVGGAARNAAGQVVGPGPRCRWPAAASDVSPRLRVARLRLVGPPASGESRAQLTAPAASRPRSPASAATGTRAAYSATRSAVPRPENPAINSGRSPALDAAHAALVDAAHRVVDGPPQPPVLHLVRPGDVGPRDHHRQQPRTGRYDAVVEAAPVAGVAGEELLPPGDGQQLLGAHHQPCAHAGFDLDGCDGTVLEAQLGRRRAGPWTRIAVGDERLRRVLHPAGPAVVSSTSSCALMRAAYWTRAVSACVEESRLRASQRHERRPGKQVQGVAQIRGRGWRSPGTG